MAEQQERPATLPEIIEGLAKKAGVPPALALSVAEAESNFNPSAISPKGARGVFQLMPDTAKEMGVANIDDPIENINGGLKYLSTLNQKYGGDVSKVLAAYNAGPGRVDAGGDLPAETQAYVTSVLSGLTRRTKAATAQAPTSPVAPAAAPTAPAAKPGLLRRVVGAFDPRSDEGLTNVASTVGGVVGGIPGAALAGAASSGANQIRKHIAEIPGAVADIARNVREGYGGETLTGAKQGAIEGAKQAGISGATQAAYEVGGRILAWPVQVAGRYIMGSGVGKAARKALTSAVDSAKETKRVAVQSAEDAAADALAATQESMAAFRDVVRKRATAATSQAKQAAAAGVKAAEQRSAAELADVEARAAADVAQVQKLHEHFLSQAPTQAAVTTGTREVLGGLPGVRGATGPAKRALDAAGKAIETAAASGPTISSKPVKAALTEMQARTRPDALFPGQQDAVAKAIGFSPSLAVSNEGKVASVAGLPTNEARAKLLETIRQQLGVAEGHPLPGVLAQVQEAPAQMTFAEAHQLKRLLDEAVSWDRTAKKHLEGMTKGVRNVLREQMSSHEPYNVATKAYADLVPLYRKGVGGDLVKAAADRPDRIAGMLKPNAPEAAKSIQDLLVGQSAAGGDELAGARAWDAIRASWTYQNLLTKGPEKLTQAVQDLTTQHPEFVRTVYGDPAGQTVLNNLKQLGTAFDEAVTSGKVAVESAKAAGERGLEKVKAEAAETVSDAVVAKADALSEASQKARQALHDRRVANRQDVQAIKRQGASAIEQARKALKEFEATRLGSFSRMSPETIEAHAGRAAMAPQTFWGMQSLFRILRAPGGAEMLQYAAHSPEMTQRLVRVLNGKALPAVAATTIRELMAAQQGDSVPNRDTGRISVAGLDQTK